MGSAKEKVSRLSVACRDSLVAVEERSPSRFFVHADARRILEVLRFLFETLGARLATVSGVDVREGFEVLYHFCLDSDGAVVTVKTILDKGNPVIDSVTPYIPGAEFIEREIHDLFGIEFKGHPKLERLILADDWPEGVYPLRKDFEA